MERGVVQAVAFSVNNIEVQQCSVVRKSSDSENNAFVLHSLQTPVVGGCLCSLRGWCACWQNMRSKLADRLAQPENEWLRDRRATCFASDKLTVRVQQLLAFGNYAFYIVVAVFFFCFCFFYVYCYEQGSQQCFLDYRSVATRNHIRTSYERRP